MARNSYLGDKEPEQLLDELMTTAQPGSVVYEAQKAAIFVRTAQKVTDALNAGRRLFWLNVILTVFTAVGAIATVIAALKP
jgi:hypothetical protein